MIDELEQRMAQVIAQMSVLSEAGASRMGDVVHGGEPSNAPKGPKLSLGDWHREAWRRAKTAEKRAAALLAAESALIEARFSQRQKSRYVPNTQEQRVAIAWADGPAKVVARKFGCSERHVYNCRRMERDRMIENDERKKVA